VHIHPVPSRQNRCAFHDHDSYGLRDTCAELGFKFSISHEMCLVVAKKKKLVVLAMSYLPDRIYIRCRFSDAKDIRDGHETILLVPYSSNLTLQLD